MSAGNRSAPLDCLLRPVHRWVWSDHCRVRKLLLFGEVATDGGRDILRAADVTPSTGYPPTHSPFRRAADILSRVRSPISSHSATTWTRRLVDGWS
jgi:hypothetical protein